MNKAELIEHVAKQADMTKADAQRAVEAVFGGITSTLKKGNDARFVGFGTFSVAKRAATTGRNPRTGEAIKIPASKNAKFKAGKELKEAVNK
ncbi:MAG: HU family DNA-binding protein [Alphaproteobacteria bacterium]|nr:HU family DNA-binding protein [Alphaproteobacteria bacterium]